MKRLALALLASFSLHANTHQHYDVCFVGESHKVLSFQTLDVESFIGEGKSVCSVHVKARDRTDAELEVVLRQALDFIKRGQPSIIYIPSEYEPFFRTHAPEMKNRLKVIKNRDVEMSKVVHRLVQDFHVDFSNVYLLYDKSTIDRKRAWMKEFKAVNLPVKPILLRTKKQLLSKVAELNRDSSRGVVINLLNELEDREYETKMGYEAIKDVLHSRNYLHLTVGVELTRRNNEAIVLRYRYRDSRTDVLLNKRAFKRLRMTDIYLNYDWKLVGGFLSEHEG